MEPSRPFILRLPNEVLISICETLHVDLSPQVHPDDWHYVPYNC